MPAGDGFDLETCQELVVQTREQFEIVGLGVQGLPSDPAPSAILRHDIDVSPSQAVELALIEANAGVSSCYMVSLTSDFYSIFESRTIRLLHAIRDLGHEMGLHFDASRYRIMSESDLVEALSWEAAILSRILGLRRGFGVSSFSFHNTSALTRNFRKTQYAGMWNAYSRRLWDDYSYTSDSNGYWIHRSWSEILKSGAARIHVLTHPEWWQAVAMPPRDRIQREVRKRAQRVMEDYDAALRATGRRNIGLHDD